MARKSKGTVSVETIKPYVERALNDPDFRNDMKDALAAARELYGPLTKSKGVTGAAALLAQDKKTQKQLKKAVDQATKAAGTLQPKKKGHKGRNTLLAAGVIAGALYNPWTGASTRQWILDKVAGDDDLQPIDGWDVPATNGGDSHAADAVKDAMSDATDTAKDASSSIGDAVEDATS